MKCSKWFKERTKLETTLFFVTILLISCITIVTGFFILSIAYVHKVCTTPQCIQAASQILNTMDRSVDPCEDFYKFACGTFLKNSYKQGQWSTLQTLPILMKNNLRQIVVEETNQTLPKTLALQRRFYKSCIDESAINTDNNETFLRLLEQLMMGIDIWTYTSLDWFQTMVTAKKLGLFYQFFFRIEVFQWKHGNDGEKNILWIKPPSRKDINSFHWKENNIETIESIAEILGLQNKKYFQSSPTDLRSTVDFADLLDKIVQRYNNSTSKADSEKINNTTIKNLNIKHNKLNWYEFLRNITNLNLKYDDVVIFDANDYFTDLYYLMKQTSNRVQANYIVWSVISSNINYLTKNVREKYQSLLSINYYDTNKIAVEKRKAVCYSASIDLFQNVAEAEYIRRHASNSKRFYIKEMIKNIKNEFEIVLKSNAWMQIKHRDYSLRQLKNIKEFVGWIDVIFNTDEFDKIFGYEQLNIKTNNIVDIARAVNYVKVNNYLKKITQNSTVTQLGFLEIPRLSVNAYFLKQLKTLIIPTPLIQPPVFDEKRPKYINYGSLGTIIGHEFTHGFSGITETDIEHEPEIENWLDNETIFRYQNATRCLVKEYKEFLRSLGRLTDPRIALEENLADFNGVNLAYTAYQNWAESNPKEDILPGLEYNQNQLFWIMSSTYMCYNEELAEENGVKVESRDNRHPVSSFRVVGPLRNSPYFAKDFNCRVGSRMNPEIKCRVYS